jgi:hypothetical protein
VICIQYFCHHPIFNDRRVGTFTTPNMYTFYNTSPYHISDATLTSRIQEGKISRQDQMRPPAILMNNISVENLFQILRRIFFESSVNSRTIFTLALWVYATSLEETPTEHVPM